MWGLGGGSGGRTADGGFFVFLEVVVDEAEDEGGLGGSEMVSWMV